MDIFRELIYSKFEYEEKENQFIIEHNFGYPLKTTTTVTIKDNNKLYIGYGTGGILDEGSHSYTFDNNKDNFYKKITNHSAKKRLDRAKIICDDAVIIPNNTCWVLFMIGQKCLTKYTVKFTAISNNHFILDKNDVIGHYFPDNCAYRNINYYTNDPYREYWNRQGTIFAIPDEYIIIKKENDIINYIIEHGRNIPFSECFEKFNKL